MSMLSGASLVVVLRLLTEWENVSQIRPWVHPVPFLDEC